MTNKELALEMRRMAHRIENEPLELDLKVEITSYNRPCNTAEHLRAMFRLADGDMEPECNGGTHWFCKSDDKHLKITAFYNPKFIKVSAAYEFEDIEEAELV